MKRAMIIKEKCVACEECLVGTKCENNILIRENPKDKPWIDFYQCRGCMKCLQYCPYDAIEQLVQPCHNMEFKMGW